MRLHESWLTKAQHDLASARMLFSGNNPILDVAVYHTEQCAEKALKAFLAFKKQPIMKTHDLSVLIDLCVDIDPDFNELYDSIENLNPYSILYRYPGEIMEPEKEEVLEAIELSEKVFKFIENKINQY